MFCRWWKPIVSHAILSRPVADQVRNESRFVRYVHFNEIVKTLKGTLSLRRKPYFDWWQDYPNTANKWIISWHCDNILKSQEYGFEEYKKSLNPKKEVEVSMQENIAARDNEFSLAESKEQLITNNYYVIARTYYNIVADVMVMASIKEGNKMFQGLTLVVRWSCTAERNDQRVETIREVRSKLSTFKSVLDQLFLVLVRDKHPQDVADNFYQKSIFGRRVRAFMRLLNVRGDDPAKHCDVEIPKTVEETSGGHDAYPVDDPVAVLKFRGYYFGEPLLHLGELYRINAYGF